MSIAITGYGTINSLGEGVSAFVEGLRAGRCGIGELVRLPREGLRSTCVAEVRELHVPGWLDPAVARHASRSALLALIAAHEAWAMAGLGPAEAPAAAIVIGTTTGGMDRGEETFARLVRGEPDRRRASAWVETPVSAPLDVLACALGCTGPRLTVSTACSSSANALAIAADWVAGGRAELALCGGVDSLCWVTLCGFNALQAVDRVPCRPFDRDRAGITLGEGAAFFVIEDRARAERRGAAVLAELAGCGVSADAHHLTQPRPDGAGAVLAMRRALADAGVAAEEVDYINAHGTGTPQNDVVETRAIRAVFGRHAERLAVSSTKSMVGHCLGAAGAIEALAGVIALREGFVPPTVNLRNPDPECDLDYVPGRSRAADLRAVLSNSYGFGGNNTSLVLRRVDG